MEIRFSQYWIDRASPQTLVDKVAHIANNIYGDAGFDFTSVRGPSVRFTLRRNHNEVIRALLTLDPDATVRTARAVYEGLEDFVRQCEARTNAPLAGAKMQRGKS